MLPYLLNLQHTELPENISITAKDNSSVRAKNIAPGLRLHAGLRQLK